MLTRSNILDILQKKKSILTQYDVKKIGLFGSYINDKQQVDIDILIDFYSSQETFDNLMSIYDVLENSFKNYKIDVVTKNGLSKHIGTYILNETEYV